MNKIEVIEINVSNLTETEQVKLWVCLYRFAIKELPDTKDLHTSIIKQ